MGARRTIERWAVAVRQTAVRPMSAAQAGLVSDSAGLMLRIIQREGADVRALHLHLAEFGRMCGAAGVEMADAAMLISSVLGHCDRRLRALLDHRSSGLRVSAGWLQGRDEASVANGSSVEHSLEALQLRIRQDHERCRRLGLEVGDVLLLAAFECDPLMLGADRASAHELAAALSEHFWAGETIAICPNGRVLVLAGIASPDAMRVRRIALAVEDALRITPGSVRSWLEPLRFDLSHLASHLDGLAA